MGALLTLISALCGIGILVCFILVLVKMFQNNETTMGIVCIVTTFLCGIGVLITFVLGWVNVGKWQIQKVMMVWTVCIVLNIVINIIAIMLGVTTVRVEGM
ncbi:MAG TPA: hypothetical protein DD670_15000 [Planctomycetaceae bacterium]|nr:hypothetical protein [Planctomycetaceae bacterium]